MGFDPISVARKRYRAVRVLRLIAVLAIGAHAWVVLMFIVWSLTGEFAEPLSKRGLLRLGLYFLVTVVTAGGVGQFAPWLVRWVLPAARPDRCPGCGDEIAHASSGRCGECGVELPGWVIRSAIPPAAPV